MVLILLVKRKWQDLRIRKKTPRIYLQEKISEVKINQNISQEEKEKIFKILKETFGKEPSPIKDQINREIDKI